MEAFKQWKIFFFGNKFESYRVKDQGDCIFYKDTVADQQPALIKENTNIIFY